MISLIDEHSPRITTIGDLLDWMMDPLHAANLHHQIRDTATLHLFKGELVFFPLVATFTKVTDEVLSAFHDAIGATSNAPRIRDIARKLYEPTATMHASAIEINTLELVKELRVDIGEQRTPIYFWDPATDQFELTEVALSKGGDHGTVLLPPNVRHGIAGMVGQNIIAGLAALGLSIPKPN